MSVEEEYLLADTVYDKYKEVYNKYDAMTMSGLLLHVFSGEELIEIKLEKQKHYRKYCDDNEDDMSYVGKLNELNLLFDGQLKGYDLSTKAKRIAFVDEITGSKAKREREEEVKEERMKKIRHYNDLEEKAKKLYPGDPEKDYFIEWCREAFMKSEGRDATPMEVKRKEYNKNKIKSIF